MSFLARRHLLHLKNKIKMTISQEARCHLLHLKKKPTNLFSPCNFELFTLCAQNLSKRRGRAKRLIVVSNNPRKTNIIKVFFLGLQRTMTSIAFVVIFCCNLIRTTKDENDCNIRNRRLCKGTKLKKKQRIKKGWCPLTCHICTLYI